MKTFLLFLSLLILLLAACSKEDQPLVPLDFTIISKSGIIVVHHTVLSKTDTLTKKQGHMTIHVPDQDHIKVERICPEPGILEYNINAPFANWNATLVKNGDINTHEINEY